MKLTKLIFAAAALSLCAGAFAQEFDDFDSFDSFDSFGSFGDDGGFGGSSSPLTVSGNVEASARAYVDQKGADTPSEWKMDYFPKAILDLEYSAASSDVEMKIKLDKTSLTEYQWDILDEFTARAYLGNLKLEAGKMKVVWGKGDKNHVLDNFNANNYLDYIIPDYIDRRLGEMMFRAEYTTSNNIRFEGIWTPVMTADRLADSGVWQPKATKTLAGGIKTAVGTLMANSTATDALGLTSGGNLTVSGIQYLSTANSLNSKSLSPDVMSLEYGQFGARTLFTIGTVDLGLSYYYGHYKQPSYDMSVLSKISNLDYVKNNLLHYDQLQVFGIEGATILFNKLNTRWELAYNMTKDFAGDDPAVHNNSIGWVFGFDMDLPVSHLNLNIQTVGKVILNGGKIEDMGALKATDVDYIGKDCYTNNKIIIDITDKYMYEKIKLDVKAVWGIERGDIAVMPDVQFKLKDQFILDVNGMYIWTNDSNSEFDGWENNSFIQVGCKYSF